MTEAEINKQKPYIPIDMTGQRYGRLVALRFIERDKKGNPRWLCQCDCGNKTIVYRHHLTSGHTSSCGCLELENKRTIGITHGKSKERLYAIWYTMRNRCNNTHNAGYKVYGGRGIKICDEWDGDYLKFRSWALSNGYDDSLTIDRIDNNGGYCPQNCRWATYKEQGNNKSTTVFIEYKGIKKPLQQWAEQIGINPGTLYYRIKTINWPIERAMTEKLRRGGKGHE